MSISFAILALLSGGPRTGYELKKLFAESENLPWSGNSNQVYGALVQLHLDGLASRHVDQPAAGPARKVYAITVNGENALREWLREKPELPLFRSPILVSLMAADLLSDDDLRAVLVGYEEELRLKVLALEELRRRGTGPSFGSARQRAIWAQINEHAAPLLRAETEWVTRLRWAIASAPREVS